MIRNKKKWMAIALAVGLAVLGAAVIVPLATAPEDTASAESLTALSAQASTASDLESPFKAVYEEVSPSVVGIQLNTQRRATNGRISSTSSFVGSGVVISDNGHVVTNYHVVTGGTDTVVKNISVVFDGEEYEAEYVAGDESYDIAVLLVEGLDAPAVKIGNSDELSIGDWALVIGNPLGEGLNNTLNVGVISGLDRDMSATDRTGRISGTTMIQTDAAINSGNSGGGLFNINGELVGITSMKLSNNGYFGSASIEGIGFAIPINTVSKIADDLIDYGEVQYPRMGVSIDTINSPSDEPTKDYLPSSVWVVEVEKDSPAEKAGIQVDDLIMEADGQRVKTTSELQAIVRGHSVGEIVEIKVYRIPNVGSIDQDEDIPEGEHLTFEVELEMLETPEAK